MSTLVTTTNGASVFVMRKIKTVDYSESVHGKLYRAARPIRDISRGLSIMKDELIAGPEIFFLKYHPGRFVKEDQVPPPEYDKKTGAEIFKEIWRVEPMVPEPFEEEKKFLTKLKEERASGNMGLGDVFKMMKGLTDEVSELRVELEVMRLERDQLMAKLTETKKKEKEVVPPRKNKPKR